MAPVWVAPELWERRSYPRGVCGFSSLRHACGHKECAEGGPNWSLVQGYSRKGACPQVPLGVCTKVQKSSAVVIAPSVTGLAQNLPRTCPLLFLQHHFNSLEYWCSGSCWHRSRLVQLSGQEVNKRNSTNQHLQGSDGPGVQRERGNKSAGGRAQCESRLHCSTSPVPPRPAFCRLSAVASATLLISAVYTTRLCVFVQQACPRVLGQQEHLTRLRRNHGAAHERLQREQRHVVYAFVPVHRRERETSALGTVVSTNVSGAVGRALRPVLSATVCREGRLVRSRLGRSVFRHLGGTQLGAATLPPKGVRDVRPPPDT